MLKNDCEELLFSERYPGSILITDSSDYQAERGLTGDVNITIIYYHSCNESMLSNKLLTDIALRY